MIHIKEDKSYLSELDLKAIDAGFAELGIHSLNFDRYYTEEQKKNNYALAQTMTKEQHNEYCEQVRIELSNKIKNVIDLIDNEFMIYQYSNEEIDYSKDNWDLYFWCNMARNYNERDMSFVKLDTNKKQTSEQQFITTNAVVELIRNLDIQGIQLRVQYRVVYNEDKVNEAVQEYCNKMNGEFIDYAGYNGKIVEFNGRYIFKKKGAKKNAYEINNMYALANILKDTI